MYYRIEYGPPAPPCRQKLPLRLMGLTSLFFVLFLLAVNAFWPEGREKLTQLLLPARNSAACREAAQVFLGQLKAGDSFYAALTAFCREIVSNAALPTA